MKLSYIELESLQGLLNRAVKHNQITVECESHEKTSCGHPESYEASFEGEVSLCDNGEDCEHLAEFTVNLEIKRPELSFLANALK